MQKLWQVLYDANADLVLAGHDHLYERFAPQDANGGLDSARGLRSFIVGTGGANHTSLTTVAANSELRNASTFGILSLTLHSSSYDWRFIPEAGKTFTDSGSAACHGSSSGSDTTPPSTPTGLSAVATSGSSVALTWNPSTDNQGVASYDILRNGSVIGTSTTTSWTDSGTSASTTCSYAVQAVDLAGNRSGPSGAVSVTTPGTLQFTPVADAYVRQDQPTVNFGSKTTVETDGSPVEQSLLRFTVAGLGTGGVASAKLRLYCTNPSGVGGEIRSVTGSWSETGVTWATSPAFGTSAAGSIGRVAAGSWYEVDVTSLVNGNGDITLGLVSSATDGADYVSREGLSSQRPQLVVTPQP